MVERNFTRADRALRAAGIRPEYPDGYSYGQLLGYKQIIRQAGGDPAIAGLPDWADRKLAWFFVDKHVRGIRYVAAWGTWMLWSGQRWRADRRLRILTIAGEYCSEVAAGITAERQAAGAASAKTIAAVERLARADRRVAVVPEDFDADPWAFNTPGGIVDLRTGELRRHDAAANLTKMAAVAPAEPGTSCPLWQDVVRQWTGGDSKLADFLQRVCGYALTGVVAEHAFFFAHGRGANGKSVFLNTISRIIGDHAITAPAETFMASYAPRHPTELAMLRGARLVAVAEIEDGQRWAVGRLQSISAGERIAARFVNGNFFEFDPVCKLIFSGNHRPDLRGANEAIRRRLQLLPFDITIPATEREPRLAEQLWREAPAILRWAIDGCLAWQRYGLAPPAAVRAASRDYIEAASGPAAWLAECAVRDPAARTARGALWDSWRAWAEQAGERVGSSRRFYSRLEEAGFEPFKSDGVRGFIGMRLASPPDGTDSLF